MFIQCNRSTISSCTIGNETKLILSLRFTRMKSIFDIEILFKLVYINRNALMIMAVKNDSREIYSYWIQLLLRSNGFVDFPRRFEYRRALCRDRSAKMDVHLKISSNFPVKVARDVLISTVAEERKTLTRAKQTFIASINRANLTYPSIVTVFTKKI